MKSIKKSAFVLSAVFVVFGLLASSAHAQQITATLTGTISDPNGAVVPGAIVTALSNETGTIPPPDKFGLDYRPVQK